MKELLGWTLAIIAGAGGIFGVAYASLEMTSFFAPRYEAVRRDVMLESRAYSEATLRELYDLQMQYRKATDDTVRATIAAAAIQQFGIFPTDRLPTDLRLFMTEIGG